MAQINNQQVMQKLIDELKLYPGKDVIPSELAEKILPVFQVNDQAVNFKESGYLRSIVDATANDSDKTFTVPSGKKWKLLHIDVDYTCTATVGNRKINLKIANAAGNLIFLTASSTSYAESHTSNLNFSLGITDRVVSLGGGERVNIEQLGLAPLTLEEGSTIRIFDKPAIAAAADDMVITMLVREMDLDDGDFPD